MKTFKCNRLLLIIISLVSFNLAASEKEKPDNDNKTKNEKKYFVKLQQLNNSGVSGKVKIEIENNTTLEIKLKAKGLEANKPHPQHIHGLNDATANATCPKLNADVNADNIISVGEGLPFYGPIVLPLPPFDLVKANGKLKYKAKFTINPKSIGSLDKRTIVLHGMTIDGNYVASTPIACGQIESED